MARVRFSILTLLTMLLGIASAQAQQPDAVKAQITAATANAVSALKTDILSTRITPALTVSQFLEQTDSMDALAEVIGRAQQIGDPRWDDSQTTCQVKLEVPGNRVAYALVSVAAVRGKASPIPAAALEQRLDDWKNRSFTAVGTSISATRVAEIRPMDVGPQWAGVSDAARSQAVAAARQNAAQNLLDGIRPINFDAGETIGDLTSHQQVQQAVRDWVASRPVTELRYDDNLQVEVTVSTPSDELLKTVLDSARAIPGTTLPSDAKTLDQLKQEFAQHASGIVGRAKVSSQPQTTPGPAIELPDQPPLWTSQPIDAEGQATRTSDSPLRTKTAAETVATINLRAKIGALNLTPNQTIDQAVKQNPRLEDALGRALLRARVYKVDYHADGSVMVGVTIDPRDLWEEFMREAGR